MRCGYPRTRALAAAAVTGVLLAVAGCGSGGSGAGGAAARNRGGGVTGPVTVFAAASLTGAFTTIGRNFEKAHPGTAVTFNFAGSPSLAMQINQGAPADVFASADPANMATVTRAGNADGTPATFARNQLVIAVPRGNPLHITGLADLARPGLKVALCAQPVPCGAAAKTALAAAGVTVRPVTWEQNVKSALTKLTLGEVDAALVYRTDTRALPSGVDGVEFPQSARAVNEYPIVVLKGAPNTAVAKAFVAYVLSADGMRVLTGAGFQAP